MKWKFFSVTDFDNILFLSGLDFEVFFQGSDFDVFEFI